MASNLPILFVAVLLLWFPHMWMRYGTTVWKSRRQHRRAEMPAKGPQEATALKFQNEFRKPRNYFDFFRAAVGTLAVVGGAGVAAAIRVKATAPHGATVHALLLQSAILVFGLLLQTVRYERRRICLAAPVFYVAGASVVLCSPWAGFSAFAIAWVLTPVMSSPIGFFVVQAVVAGPLGELLRGHGPLPIIGATLSLVPVALSLLSRRELVVFSRRPHDANRGGGA